MDNKILIIIAVVILFLVFSMRKKPGVSTDAKKAAASNKNKKSAASNKNKKSASAAAKKKKPKNGEEDVPVPESLVNEQESTEDKDSKLTKKPSEVSSTDRFFMYGPWLTKASEFVDVELISVDPVDGNIYMLQSGEHVKMVNDAGVAKYYTGKTSDFDRANWNSYTDAQGNYKLRKCNLNCNTGCDESRECVYEKITTGNKFNIKNKGNGYCVHPKDGTGGNNTELVFNSNCGDNNKINYELLPGGQLQHVASGRCVHPRGNLENGTALMLHDICDDRDWIKFDLLKNGLIRHRPSGKCVLPEGGAGADNGKRLHLWDSCNTSANNNFEFVEYKDTIKNYKKFDNLDYGAGRDLEVIYGDLEKCKQRCNSNKNCVGFTKLKNKDECYLREKIPEGSTPQANTNVEGYFDISLQPLIDYADSYSPFKPVNKFVIKNKRTGNCVHPTGGVPNHRAELLYHPGCGDSDNLTYKLLPDGQLQNVQSGRCIHPRGNIANGTVLILHDGCNYDHIKFDLLKNGIIRHRNSGKCIHADGGKADENKRLFLWDGCNESANINHEYIEYQ